jgi:flagellar M-ring protein FliF
MIGWEQLERLWSSLLGLGAKRLGALAVVGFTIFAAVGAAGYYLSRPEFETLYTGLGAQDVSRIGSALREFGIAFDVNSLGTAVLVRSGQTAQARMLLAEKGLPSSSGAGYELFDKMGSMGLTSFMQEVTRVRALEGEIARTIQAMKGVKAARVHIVLPDNGSFRRARQAPSASVIIRTESSGDFSTAAAIRHLVAAAVPSMTVDQVTILSTDGTVLASGGDSASAAPSKMMGLEQTINKELQDNIAKTLTPVLGQNNFEISVSARLNTDKRQINETSYNPESRVERSVRVVKETGNTQNTNNRSAVGVEQNVPADQPAAASGEQSKKSNERREELTNYEVSSKTTATISEGYKIENLTAAVVLNRKQLLASLGAGAAPDALDKLLKEVERLAGSAAGIDPQRGDRITVAALDFVHNADTLEPIPSAGWSELLLRHTATLLNALTALGVTALLVWFGVRPAIRALSISAQGSGEATALQSEPMANEPPGMIPQAQTPHVASMAAEPEPSLISDLTSKMERSPQKRLEQLVDFDEEQAALILKQWMNGAQSA